MVPTAQPRSAPEDERISKGMGLPDCNLAASGRHRLNAASPTASRHAGKWGVNGGGIYPNNYELFHSLYLFVDNMPIHVVRYIH